MSTGKEYINMHRNPSRRKCIHFKKYNISLLLLLLVFVGNILAAPTGETSSQTHRQKRETNNDPDIVKLNNTTTIMSPSTLLLGEVLPILKPTKLIPLESESVKFLNDSTPKTTTTTKLVLKSDVVEQSKNNEEPHQIIPDLQKIAETTIKTKVERIVDDVDSMKQELMVEEEPKNDKEQQKIVSDLKESAKTTINSNVERIVEDVDDMKQQLTLEEQQKNSKKQQQQIFTDTKEAAKTTTNTNVERILSDVTQPKIDKAQQNTIQDTKTTMNPIVERIVDDEDDMKQLINVDANGKFNTSASNMATTESILKAIEQIAMIKSNETLASTTTTTARSTDYARAMLTTSGLLNGSNISNGDHESSTRAAMMLHALIMSTTEQQLNEAEGAVKQLVESTQLEPTVGTPTMTSTTESIEATTESLANKQILHSHENSIDTATNDVLRLNEKRPKFINDNSTNAQQMNLPNRVEVWSLASMKMVPGNKTYELGNEIEEQKLKQKLEKFKIAANSSEETHTEYALKSTLDATDIAAVTESMQLNEIINENGKKNIKINTTTTATTTTVESMIAAVDSIETTSTTEIIKVNKNDDLSADTTDNNAVNEIATTTTITIATIKTTKGAEASVNDDDEDEEQKKTNALKQNQLEYELQSETNSNKEKQTAVITTPTQLTTTESTLNLSALNANNTLTSLTSTSTETATVTVTAAEQEAMHLNQNEKSAASIQNANAERKMDNYVDVNVDASSDATAHEMSNIASGDVQTSTMNVSTLKASLVNRTLSETDKSATTTTTTIKPTNADDDYDDDDDVKVSQLVEKIATTTVQNLPIVITKNNEKEEAAATSQISNEVNNILEGVDKTKIKVNKNKLEEETATEVAEILKVFNGETVKEKEKFVLAAETEATTTTTTTTTTTEKPKTIEVAIAGEYEEKIAAHNEKATTTEQEAKEDEEEEATTTTKTTLSTIGSVDVKEAQVVENTIITAATTTTTTTTTEATIPTTTTRTEAITTTTTTETAVAAADVKVNEQQQQQQQQQQKQQTAEEAIIEKQKQEEQKQKTAENVNENSLETNNISETHEKQQQEELQKTTSATAAAAAVITTTTTPATTTSATVVDNKKIPIEHTPKNVLKAQPNNLSEEEDEIEQEENTAAVDINKDNNKDYDDDGTDAEDMLLSKITTSTTTTTVRIPITSMETIESNKNNKTIEHEINLLEDNNNNTTITTTTTTPKSIATKIEEIYKIITTTTTTTTKTTETAIIDDSSNTEINSITEEESSTSTSNMLPKTNIPPNQEAATIATATTLKPNNNNFDINFSAINPTIHFNPTDMDMDNLQTKDAAGNETDVNVIIAITVSVIGVVALILLVAFLYLMRKRQKQMSYGQRCRPVSLDAYSMDNVSVLGSVRRKGALRASKRSYGNAAFDDPALRHNLLSAAELSKFLERRSSVFEEFRDVPQIIARADEVPAGCEDKNRYANVIPLPETRVVLQQLNDDDKTEYINANYVRGPKDAPNYYIACQAPLESTVIDFWRMIWEQQSRVIIQATDLTENGIEKCAEYLPPSVTLDNHTTFGDYQVTLKNREVKDKYAISTLMLKNTLENSSRELTHYWYKWPEAGVPNEEAPIIAMLLEARSSLKSYAIEQANELKEKSSTLTLKSVESITDSSGGEQMKADTSSASSHTVAEKETTSVTIEINGNVSMEKLKAAARNQGPLTIHCSPGTGRTGCIIACDMAIRSLEMPKRSVDIPQIVYYVRRGRASAVQTKEQYEFIYKVANMYATKITNLSNDN